MRTHGTPVSHNITLLSSETKYTSEYSRRAHRRHTHYKRSTEVTPLIYPFSRLYLHRPGVEVIQKQQRAKMLHDFHNVIRADYIFLTGN